MAALLSRQGRSPRLAVPFGRVALGCWILACAESPVQEQHVSTKIPDHGGRIAIAGGDRHHRDLDLGAGTFLEVVADQQGIDVLVRLLDPAGDLVWEVDSPNGKTGREELVEIVERAGRYRLEVVAFGTGTSGYYVFEEIARRPHTDQDRALVEADRAYHGGRKLAKKQAYDDAVDSFHRALAVWRQLSLPRREAFTLLDLCLAHRELGEPQIALTFCDQAAERFQSVGDSHRAAIMLDWAGLLHLWLGQTTRAVPYFEQALPLLEQAGDERGIALCGIRLATAYKNVGKIRPALRLLEDLAERIDPRPTESRAGTLVDMASLMSALNQLEKAQALYLEARDVYQQLGKDHGKAVALRGLADTTARLGDTEKANAYVREALRLYASIENPRSHALALWSLSRIRRMDDDLNGALKAIENAIRLSREAGDRRIEAHQLIELGHLRVRSGDAEAGLVELERAQALLAELGESLGVASARARAAEALRDLGRLEEARDRIALALDAVETIRVAAQRQDQRTTYFASRQEYFEIAIDVLLRLHQKEPDAGHHLDALTTHERRLARELRDSLSDQESTLGPADPALRARERSLERQLRNLADRRKDPQVARQINEVLESLHQLWAEMQADRMLPPHRPNVDLAEIRGRLDHRSLVLVYALGQEHSTLWTLTPDRVDVHELPARGELEGLAEVFSARIVRGSAALRETRHEAARRLSEALMAPVADQLGDRRLILVLDGMLQTVPFAALPEPAGDDDDYLLRGHEIVALPSLSSLALLRGARSQRSPRKTIAIFADPVFTVDDERFHRSRASPGSASEASGNEPPADYAAAVRDLERSAKELGFNPLARLAGARTEVRNILSLVPQDQRLLKTGFEATRESFLALEAGSYRILHFATHAVMSLRHPELSGLVLSLVDESGQPRNGYLRAYEIARLDLPVDLVCLSACETGTGRAIRGEGVLHLARAFLDAGAKRVLATLWKVNDGDTAALMSEFYRAYLDDGRPPAAALRTAQLALIGNPQTAEPYSWAAFVLQGDWRPHDR